MKKAPILIVAAMVTAAIATACTPAALSVIHATGAKRPAPNEFGLRPRASVGGRYIATLEPAGPLRVREAQTIRLLVRDGQGRPTEEAQIAVDGSMPQYGHGLPSQPRVTMNVATGVYEIEGVRFPMGGWWELRVEIAGSRGTDTVVFNLEL